MSTVERFWSKADRDVVWDACWEWLAGKDKDGYGKFAPTRTSHMRAHRYAYILEYGEIPAGKEVCHRCDNPSCVRPSHLWLGTNAENQADKKAKGRAPQGERNTKAKLTDQSIVEIRLLAAQGFRNASIAKRFGVSPAAISAVVLRRSWRHIP